jgi:hypothetical protein
VSCPSLCRNSIGVYAFIVEIPSVLCVFGQLEVKVRLIG